MWADKPNAAVPVAALILLRIAHIYVASIRTHSLKQYDQLM